VSFFCWKKPHIIYIGNKKTPFSTNQGFFLSKKKLCWKTIKILKHFLSQKLTQFFTFFSTRHFRLKNIYNFQTLLSRKHFTLKILRFSKYCLKTHDLHWEKEVFPMYTTIDLWLFYIKRGPSESFVLRTGNNFLYTNFHAVWCRRWATFSFWSNSLFVEEREKERWSCSSQS